MEDREAGEKCKDIHLIKLVNCTWEEGCLLINLQSEPTWNLGSTTRSCIESCGPVLFKVCAAGKSNDSKRASSGG